MSFNNSGSDSGSDSENDSISVLTNDSVNTKNVYESYPYLNFIYAGLFLINKVIHHDNTTLNNKEIYDKIKEILDNNNSNSIINENDHNELLKIIKKNDHKKLLKIIKKILDILKPYSLIDDLRTSLFKSNIYDENKPPKTETKQIQVLLYKSLIEGDPNLNYITNIITNHRNSFLAVENTFAELNTIGRSISLPQLEPKIDKLIKKRIKPFALPVAGSGTVSGGKNKKINKKTNKKTNKRSNKRSKIKKQKIHRNKTSKL